MTNANDDFFVGYENRRPRAWKFWSALVVLLLAGFGALAFAFGRAPTDPGDGRVRPQQTVTGIIEAAPYPVLRALPSEAHPLGRAIMLSGWTKVGVQRDAKKFHGQLVDVRGLLLQRGALDMLNVRARGGVRETQAQLSDDERAFTPARAIARGRFRIAGEICDGKCYAGVMKPGERISHRACANLCLLGGVPPVFVTRDPQGVLGQNFLLLAGVDGGALPARYLDLTALLISLEGEVEQRDDLLIFKVNIAQAEVL